MTVRIESARSTSRIIWANKSFPGRYGRYVAVRLRGTSLSVGVRHHEALQWMPAHKALTEREAERWARWGF
jgi:hypothetical protein